MRKTADRLATSAAGLLILTGLLIVTGWLLHGPYAPTVGGAHASVAGLHRSFFWSTLQGFHHWGGMVMLVHAGIHLGLMLWHGWHRPPQTARWIATVTLFVCAFLFQVTGNLLPMDRHAVQTAVTEANLAAQVPVVGSALSGMILAGDSFGPGTLARWYWLHRWGLPMLLVLGTIGSLLAHWGRRDAEEDRGWMWLSPTIALALALGLRVPQGLAATAGDFMRTDTGPNWYTWPLNGMFNFFDRVIPGQGWIGLALIPALVVLYLFLLPWLGRRQSDGAIRLQFMGMAVFILFVAIGCGGPVPSPTERQEPVRHANPPGGQAQAPVHAADAQVALGKRLFIRELCSGCHTLDEHRGRGGTDLNDAWRTNNDPDYYVRYIRDPSGTKPGSTMPPYPYLTEEELRALAAYLLVERPTGTGTAAGAGAGSR